MQAHPNSTPQVAEQPSPLTKFPSSQASAEVTIPSPQIDEQRSGDVDEPPMHVQPNSTLHADEHPS